MAVRRSARLKSKEEECNTKQLEYSRKLHTPRRLLNSSSSSEDEPVSKENVRSDSDSDLGVQLAVTPSSKRAHTTNNFLKVYNSYNYDRGYDLYEGEFIDDTCVDTPRRKVNKRRRKHKASDVQADETGSSSDSEILGQRAKRKCAAVQESSDEELSPINTSKNDSPTGKEIVAEEKSLNETGDSSKKNDVAVDASDSESSLKGSRVIRKKSRLDSYLLDSSEEEVKTEKKTPKRRRVQRPESDDEISFSPVRKTSTRAERLKREKMLKRDTLLQRLKNNKDSKSSTSPEDSEKQPPENFGEVFEQPSSPKKKPPGRDVQLLGEKVLFPAAESEDSSDEESDWIVSDDDGEDELDASAFIDMELMRGVYSSVIVRERVEPHLEDEESVRSDGVEGETRDEAADNAAGDEMEMDASDSVEDVSGVGREARTRASVEGVSDAEDDLETRLFKALTCENTLTALTRIFPEAKSIINSKLEGGHTALMLASLRGDTNALKLLLEHEANVNCFVLIMQQPSVRIDFSKLTSDTVKLKNQAMCREFKQEVTKRLQARFGIIHQDNFKTDAVIDGVFLAFDYK